MEVKSTIHYIDLLSNPFLDVIENFVNSVRSDSNIEKDDQERWDMDRIVKYKFDECLYTKVNGKIVNMTFNKWYNDFLRVGVNSYTLTPYRSVVFRPIWKEGGYLDIVHNANKNRVIGYFCTYYPKNNKIQSVVKMLNKQKEKRNFSFSGQSPGWLNNFYIYNPNLIYFRNVFQFISYANNKGKAEINYKNLIKTLTQN